MLPNISDEYLLGLLLHVSSADLHLEPCVYKNKAELGSSVW